MAENAHFTSWADLYQQLRNDLASPSLRTMQNYTITAGGGSGNRSVTYRGLAELLSLIEYVKKAGQAPLFIFETITGSNAFGCQADTSASARLH